MSLNKLSKMVNAKNAMSRDWGEMLYQYMETVTSKTSAKQAKESGAIANALNDGKLDFYEVIGSECLDMSRDLYFEMGGYTEQRFRTQMSIDKLTFIKAMKRFCSEASECRKDISKC